MEITNEMRPQILNEYRKREFSVVAEHYSDGDQETIGSAVFTFAEAVDGTMKQVGEVVIEIPAGATVERIAINSTDGSKGGTIAYQEITDGHYKYGGRLIVESITLRLL